MKRYKPKGKMMLKELREANTERQKEWGGDDRCDVAFRAVEVAGETGEMLEKVKKYLRGERGIQGTTASAVEVADEMADVVIGLDLLAAQMGINLAAAVPSKFNQTSEKYGFKTRMQSNTTPKRKKPYHSQ